MSSVFKSATLIIKQTGNDYKLLKDYFNKALKAMDPHVLKECGEMGVARLKAATPVRTGKTANSWYYEVIETKTGHQLIFYNTNKGSNASVSVAILIQYGHGTDSGIWIEGLDYINPALRPIFQDLGERIWKEVTIK